MRPTQREEYCVCREKLSTTKSRLADRARHVISAASRGYNSSMRLVRNITVAVLLLSLFGVPAMACLTASQPMTAAEHECCRRMSYNCGSMSGATQHACCQVTTRPSSPFLSVSHFSLEAHAVVLGIAILVAIVLHSNEGEPDINAISHSPPLSESTVLRI